MLVSLFFACSRFFLSIVFLLKMVLSTIFSVNDGNIQKLTENIVERLIEPGVGKLVPCFQQLGWKYFLPLQDKDAHLS